MKGLLLQDWVTVRADQPTGGTNVPQLAAGWLDVGFASDLTFFLEVSQRNGGTLPKLHYETSPFRDASLFRDLAVISLPASPLSTVPYLNTTAVTLYSNPSVPPGRWVRWRLTTGDVGSTWDVTFRVTVLGYPR